MGKAKVSKKSEGRIGSLPADGCQLTLIADEVSTRASLRDRVTVDLRGIADAVRRAAAGRGQTLAAFARGALIAQMGTAPGAAVGLPGPIGLAPSLAVRSGPAQAVRLTLRLPEADAQRLVDLARESGLSYGDVVARLVAGAALPEPSHDREADRAALLASTDQVAAIAADLRLLLRLLSKSDAKGMQPFRDRIHRLDADVYRHLDLASTFISKNR
jgi:hypothetical protein